jgi:hypothetical protein
MNQALRQHPEANNGAKTAPKRRRIPSLNRKLIATTSEPDTGAQLGVL